MRHKDTDKMQTIVDYTRDYYREVGQMPTTREIGKQVGLTHAMVLRYLEEMNERGMLSYENGRITNSITEKHNRGTMVIPIAGRIPCGTPTEEEQSIDSYITVSRDLLGSSGDFFILIASGDSMIDAGIDNLDMVFIKRELDPKPGQIVAALIDGNESTLKTFRQDPDGTPFLWAENEGWTDEQRRIKAQSISVQGVAVKVLRNVPLMTA